MSLYLDAPGGDEPETSETPEVAPGPWEDIPDYIATNITKNDVPVVLMDVDTFTRLRDAGDLPEREIYLPARHFQHASIGQPRVAFTPPEVTEDDAQADLEMLARQQDLDLVDGFRQSARYLESLTERFHLNTSDAMTELCTAFGQAAYHS